MKIKDLERDIKELEKEQAKTDIIISKLNQVIFENKALIKDEKRKTA
jgi:uncharacterized coiled-coil protein SlyX